MPEETVQRNIGGVADTGEVIAHDLSGLYHAVAGLLNGHAEIGGLVVGGELDDLVWILDLGLHLLTAELIVLGCGHLRNKVAAQRQRIGSGDAACIGHNIAHDLTGTGLRDLKHRAFQSRAGALASDEVIVSTILADLDLTGYSAVLPFDLRALTRLNIDGFVLLIADVALGRLQFTDIVLAGSQLVINVDVAILIRRILANGILACIVQDELDTIDTLAGSRIDLMDHNRRHALIGDLHRGGLTVLDADIDGRGIQLVALGCLQLGDGIPSILRIGDADDTVAVSRVGAKDLAVDLPNLEFDTLDACAGILIRFDDLETTSRSVIEGQRLKIIGIDYDGLGSGLFIDHIAGDGLRLCDDQRANDAADQDLTVFVRPIDPVGRQLATFIRHIAAIGVSHTELNACQRLASNTVQFHNAQAAERLIAELHRHDLVGAHFDGLWRVVQDIAGFCTHFLDDQCSVGIKAIDQNGADAIGYILTVSVAHDGAVGLCDHEFHIGQRLAGNCINLFNQDTTLGLIPEGDGDDILFVATQIYRLNIVFAQHIAVWCGDLLNDIGASLQTCEDESAVGRSLTLSDDCASSTGGAAKEPHAEPCTLKRITGAGVYLLDDDGAQGGVLKSDDLAAPRFHIDLLGSGIFDGIARSRLQLGDGVPAVIQLIDEELTVLIRVVGTKITNLTGRGLIGTESNIELRTLNGIAGNAVDLIDCQGGLGIVLELDGASPVGKQRDHLMCFVEQIAIGY